MTRRRTPSTLALAGVLTLATLALAGHGPATAAGAAGLHVPNHATLTIDGRGFGHGHGLSQYGAEGAARKGKSARQIVHFYYPHTKAGTFSGKVEVLLTADTDHNTTVVTSPGLEVHDLGDGSTTAVPTHGAAGKATRWRLSPGSAGGTRVSYLNGSWRVWKKLTGDSEFRASGPLTLVVGSQRVTYRGTLQLRTLATGPAKDRVTVNKVPLDDYVRGVVPREMPASWHQAALRAQAIAARTYAAFESEDSSNPVYQLCDTSACQVYGGMSAEDSRTNQAVTKTAHEVRDHHGVPAFTQFSASDGGWTSAGGQPYLIAKKDRFDGWSGNPYSSWTVKVSAGKIEQTWPVLGNLTAITIKQREGHGRWGGRVDQMTLHGSKGDKVLTGDDFRSALGLRSTWFHLTA